MTAWPARRDVSAPQPHRPWRRTRYPRSVSHQPPKRSGLELHCPFPSNIHPDAELFNIGTVAWAREMGLIETERQRQHLLMAKVGCLISRAFPSGRSAALQLATDWTTLFCWLDDRIERLQSPMKVGAFLDMLLETFRGETQQPDVDEPAVRALLDLRARMLAEGSPQWVARFAERLEQLFVCFTAEATNRTLRVNPRLDTYLQMRQVTVGLYVEFEFFELTEGICLPEEVRQHPAVRQLMARASNAVGWANDLFTYEKEIQEGEIHNLVRILMNDQALPLQEAAELTVRMIDAEVEAFIEEEASLPSFGPTVTPQLQRFTQMLRCWIRGHLDWAFETGRYRRAA